jgi:hypothetical protein
VTTQAPPLRQSSDTFGGGGGWNVGQWFKMRKNPAKNKFVDILLKSQNVKQSSWNEDVWAHGILFWGGGDYTKIRVFATNSPP